MDSLGALNAFVQAAEARSFTAAGRQLGVSPSAIGKAISRLEERLGVRLFHRSTRTITLTPEGTLFLERCRRIFGEIETAEQELAQTKGAPRGKLRVSMPLAGMLMMPTLTAFMRAYPEIELDLDFSDRLVEVIDEGFDAVVRAGEVNDSRLMTRKLGEFHLKLVGSPAYSAARGTPHRPADLASHACLPHRYATSGKLEPSPLRRTRKDFVLPDAAVVNTIEPLVYMAEHGLGIACLPDFAIRRQLEEGTLLTVLYAYVNYVGVFQMLWPSSRYLPPELRGFRRLHGRASVCFLTERGRPVHDRAVVSGEVMVFEPVNPRLPLPRVLHILCGRSSPPNCLVARRHWDPVRWAIAEYASRLWL